MWTESGTFDHPEPQEERETFGPITLEQHIGETCLEAYKQIEALDLANARFDDPLNTSKAKSLKDELYTLAQCRISERPDVSIVGLLNSGLANQGNERTQEATASWLKEVEHRLFRSAIYEAYTNKVESEVDALLGGKTLTLLAVTPGYVSTTSRGFETTIVGSRRGPVKQTGKYHHYSAASGRITIAQAGDHRINASLFERQSHHQVTELKVHPTEG